MNKYETVIVAKPELENKADDIIAKYTDIINRNGGEVEETENIGIRRMPYEAYKRNEGLYIRLYFKGESSTVRELKRIYRIDDDVMKFMVIAKEDDMFSPE